MTMQQVSDENLSESIDYPEYLYNNEVTNNSDVKALSRSQWVQVADNLTIDRFRMQLHAKRSPAHNVNLSIPRQYLRLLQLR